jgi:phosphoglycolate phosphatase
LIQRGTKKIDVDLIVFDLDGTLIDSKADIAFAVNQTFIKMGIPTMPIDEIEAFVGTGVSPLLTDKMRQQNPDRIKEGFKVFTQLYKDSMLKETKLYPGVLDVLNHFSSKQKVILTNKRFEFVDPILNGMGISNYFVMKLGADSLPFKKPDPRTLLHICEHLKIAPNKTLMVGDTETDIKTGLAAQTKTCAVTYGYGSEIELNQLAPDFMISKIAQLINLIT